MLLAEGYFEKGFYLFLFTMQVAEDKDRPSSQILKKLLVFAFVFEVSNADAWRITLVVMLTNDTN